MGVRERDAFIHLSGFIVIFDSPHGAECMALTPRRIDGSTATGVCISRNAQPRLTGNEIWGNRVGIFVEKGGDPFLSGNTIRDHVGVNDVGVHGVGVFVHHSSHGLATVLPDNVFLRNAGGDVVREAAPPPDDEEEEEDD